VRARLRQRGSSYALPASGTGAADSIPAARYKLEGSLPQSSRAEPSNPRSRRTLALYACMYMHYCEPMFEQCLYFSLAAVNRQIARVWTDAFRPLGLSPSHAYLLAAVIETGDASQRSLGEAMALEASTIARFVDELERRGLVTRQRHGRSVSVRASTEGERMGRLVTAEMKGLYRQMQRRLGAARFDDLVKQLHLLREELSAEGQ